MAIPAHLPDPLTLLQNLLQIKTVNGVHDEEPAVRYLADLLTTAGFNCRLFSKTDGRLNLVTRLPGRGEAPPLLLQGHVDTVPVTGQTWTHDPFAGTVADGYVWGRGALDMKGPLAILVIGLLQAKFADWQPAGDIIFAAVSDEEAGGVYGAKFLVEEHADLFTGVRHSLTEFGGFNLRMFGRTFYPIQVAEKQRSSWRGIIKGPGGHASTISRTGTTAALARVLDRLNTGRLPVHITPPVDKMLAGMAAAAPFPHRLILSALRKPRSAALLLRLLSDQLQILEPLLRHTFNPTIIRGGDKINVLPAEIELQIDGRLLPGTQPEQLQAEVEALVGDDMRVTCTEYEPGPTAGNLDLFPLLKNVLSAADPTGTPIPLVLPAVTDARHFSKLGIQSYGFTPMQLPSDYNFTAAVHAADERLPVDALSFGPAAVAEVLRRYTG